MRSKQCRVSLPPTGPAWGAAATQAPAGLLCASLSVPTGGRVRRTTPAGTQSLPAAPGPGAGVQAEAGGPAADPRLCRAAERPAGSPQRPGLARLAGGQLGSLRLALGGLTAVTQSSSLPSCLCPKSLCHRDPPSTPETQTGQGSPGVRGGAPRPIPQRGPTHGAVPAGLTPTFGMTEPLNVPGPHFTQKAGGRLRAAAPGSPHPARRHLPHCTCREGTPASSRRHGAHGPRPAGRWPSPSASPWGAGDARTCCIKAAAPGLGPGRSPPRARAGPCQPVPARASQLARK